MSELTPLEFSPPKPRYEAIAEHTTDKGQKFIIRVSSYDEAALNEYIKNFQADLEYLSEDVNVASSSEAENTFIDEETIISVVKNNFANNIEVFIEAVPNVDINEEQVLSFSLKSSSIEASIDGDDPVVHTISIPNPQNSKTSITVNALKSQRSMREIETFRERDIEIGSGKEYKRSVTPNTKTNITAHRGKIKAELLEDGRVIESKDINSVNTHSFTIPNSPAKKYAVRITGLAFTTNQYSINGNIKVT